MQKVNFLFSSLAHTFPITEGNQCGFVSAWLNLQLLTNVSSFLYFLYVLLVCILFSLPLQKTNSIFSILLSFSTLFCHSLHIGVCVCVWCISIGNLNQCKFSNKSYSSSHGWYRADVAFMELLFFSQLSGFVNTVTCTNTK